jgi:hypothetical protein
MPMQRALPDEPTLSWYHAAAVYAVLAAVYFLTAFFSDRQLFGTDYLGAALPVHEFLTGRIATGELPYWIPHLFGGVPTHANPGSTWYPLWRLFALVLPVQRVLPAVLAVQFALGGLGMFFLARGLGARAWIALLAGLSYEFTGIIASFVYAGHDGRIIVATLAPLFLYFLHLGVTTGRVMPFAGAALTIGAALMSFQLQSCYYLLLGGGVFVIALLAKQRPRPAAAVRLLGMSGAAVALGVCAAAVTLLPLRDYVAESPRGAGAELGYEFSSTFATSPRELTGLAAPEHVGVLDEYRGSGAFKLHTEYVGALVLVCLFLAPVMARRSFYWWSFGGLALFFLSIALGSATPLYRVYYTVLPFIARFRAPTIAMYMVSLCLVVMASLTLEQLARRAVVPRRLRVPLVAAVAIPVLISLVMLDAPGGTAIASGWLRFAAAAAATGAVVALWGSGAIRARVAFLMLAITTVVDLWIVDRRFYRTDVARPWLYAEDEVVAFLRRQQTTDRVWVFPFPIGEPGQLYLGNGRFGPRSNYLMHHGFEMVGGEHGNQPERWNRLVGSGKSAVIDWHNLIERPPFLDIANVGWIVSGVELQLSGDTAARSGLRLAFESRDALVYRNERVLPRAYLVARAVPVEPGTALAAMEDVTWNPVEVAIVEPVRGRMPDDIAMLDHPAIMRGSDTVDVTHREPGRLSMRTLTVAPRFLVVSENFVVGWRATIDKRPATIVRANFAFQGVVVPPGAHEVEFVFDPPSVRVGLQISLVTWLVLLAGITWGLVPRHRVDPDLERAGQESAT